MTLQTNRIHCPAFDRAVLLALLENSDVEPVGAGRVRLSVIVPAIALDYFENVGGGEEDFEPCAGDAPEHDEADLFGLADADALWLFLHPEQTALAGGRP